MATWSGSFDNDESNFRSAVLWDLPNAPTADQDDEHTRNRRQAWLEEIFHQDEYGVSPGTCVSPFSAKLFVTRRLGETVLLASTGPYSEVYDGEYAGDDLMEGTAILQFEEDELPAMGADDLTVQVCLEARPGGMQASALFGKRVQAFQDFQGFGTLSEELPNDEMRVWLEQKVPWQAALSGDDA